MTQEQIKQKARDYAQSEFNNDYSKLDEQGKTAFHFLERGYSMALRNLNNQCFDLIPTGSLPMTRETFEQWLNDEFPLPDALTIKTLEGKPIRNLQHDAARTLYDYLASLSSAAPAMRWVKASEEIPHDYDWVDTHFMLDGKKSDGCLDRQEGGKIVFEYRSANGWQIVEDLSRIEWLDEKSAPAPVGVTEDTLPVELLDAANVALAKLKSSSPKMLEAVKEVFKAAEAIGLYRGKALTAPVSSAAQPATGYSEERGHSTNPNVQEKASKGPQISVPEWLNKHNSGG